MFQRNWPAVGASPGPWLDHRNLVCNNQGNRGFQCIEHFCEIFYSTTHPHVDGHFFKSFLDPGPDRLPADNLARFFSMDTDHQAQSFRHFRGRFIEITTFEKEVFIRFPFFKALQQ